jgi:drug/metabolite transporter (DMT)-like permease
MRGLTMPGMTARKDHLDHLAIALLVGCCLFWGLQQVLVKVTIREIAPVYQASVRFALATTVIVLWSVLRGKRLLDRDRSLLPGIVAGLLFAVEFAGIYLGLQNTTVARLTIFLYTAPFWVAVVLPLVIHAEGLNRAQWTGLVIAFAGVVVAFQDGLAANGHGWVGDLMGVVAGAAWGLTTVVIRSTVLVRISPEKMLLYQVGTSALLLPLVSLMLGEAWSVTFSPFAAASIVVQATVGAFVTYLLWIWMITRYPATKISSFTFLVPVFALAAGVVVLREPMRISLVLSLACVAAGIVLVNRR